MRGVPPSLGGLGGVRPEDDAVGLVRAGDACIYEGFLSLSHAHPLSYGESISGEHLAVHDGGRPSAARSAAALDGRDRAEDVATADRHEPVPQTFTSFTRSLVHEIPSVPFPRHYKAVCFIRDHSFTKQTSTIHGASKLTSIHRRGCHGPGAVAHVAHEEHVPRALCLVVDRKRRPGRGLAGALTPMRHHLVLQSIVRS